MDASAMVDSAQQPQQTPVKPEPKETPVKAVEAGSSVKTVEAGSAKAGAPVEAPRAEAAASSTASSNAGANWLDVIAKRAEQVTVQDPPAKARRTQANPSAGQRRVGEN